MTLPVLRSKRKMDEDGTEMPMEEHGHQAEVMEVAENVVLEGGEHPPIIKKPRRDLAEAAAKAEGETKEGEAKEPTPEVHEPIPLKDEAHGLV